MCITYIKRRTIKEDSIIQTESGCHVSHNNCDDADINNQPTLDYTCGRLTGLQRDGAQVVEVIKPLYKPYGFFIAKGRMRNSKRMFNELEKRKDRVIKCQNSNTREIYDF
ncbi:uncharacterized protein LOC143233943 [Tachypleus tridentatus]|uniref:uncharacterized protein LOC143233943 n=1 Tax=Tachypleus tridentatus TaxID=6853 RepID=UPI003FD653A1